MVRALVWKEVREQWAVWLILALTAVGGVVGLQQLLSDSFERKMMLISALYVMAWVYGLVCGSLLFAGEIEEETQTFLDTLPETRWRLWLVKAGTGLGLLVAQVMILVGIGFAFFRAETGLDNVLLGVGLPFCGIIGYAWGMFCGVFASNVLNAVGGAIMLQIVAQIGSFCTMMLYIILMETLLYYLRSWNFFRSLHDYPWLWHPFPLFLLFTGLFAVGATAGSKRIYCNTDRLRRKSVDGLRSKSVNSWWVASLWLVWRQGRQFALGMVLCGLLGALLVIHIGPMVWIWLTLIAGILCGVTAFMDEQQSGAYRFLGEQRFPLGRIWFTKASIRFATGFLAMILVVIVGAPVIGMEWDRASRAELFMPDGRLTDRGLIGLLVQPALFLTIWFVYGYAVGLAFGLLFQKTLVATVVAFGVAVPLVALWVPSLVGGGLHGWQVWGVPAILLIATYLLMRPWSAGRLLSVRGIGVTAGAFLAAGLWFAMALWYRVAEIPPVPDAIDVAAYKASLPTPEENTGGRLMASALHLLVAETEHAFKDKPPQLGPPLTFESYFQWAESVSNRGWTAGDSPLGAWLDRIFDASWVKQLNEAAVQPIGMIVDPRKETLFSRETPWIALKVPFLLTARSLQQQEKGDPALFVENLPAGLALACNLRYHTDIKSVQVSRPIEQQMTGSVDHWLEQLNGRPDLLRRALVVLQQYEEKPQANLEDVRKAEFLLALNTFDDPQLLLRGIVDSFNGKPPPGPIQEADLLRFSWQVPWEKIRLRRLLEALTSLDKNRLQHAREISPPLFRLCSNFNFLNYWKDKSWIARPLCQARAAILQVALRLYQAETGKPAEKLTDLVPKYLPAVPDDPYDGKPFRYRLSSGEILKWPLADCSNPTPNNALVGPPAPEPLPIRKVSAGQGILWCVGEDGHDDGGHAQIGSTGSPAKSGEDIIFLVPLPPN